MFSEYGGRPGPPGQWSQPHPPMYGAPGHYPTGSGAPMMGAPMGYPGAPRRGDPTSEVFTCLFGDLFVKW